MDWFFRQPLPLLFVEIVGAFVGVTLGGMLVFTPVRRRLQARFARSSDQAAYFGTQIWLAYTLILSLDRGRGMVASTSRRARRSRRRWRRWRCCSAARSSTRSRCGDYARTVADGEWAEQRVGAHPSAAKDKFAAIVRLLGDFEPRNLPDQMIHAETLRQLTTASETRRARIHATGSSLPGVVWVVLLVGAAIALTGATLFVAVDDTALHLVLVGCMAAFVGLVVFVTVALDHPFQGAVTPSDVGFRLIADRPFGGLSQTRGD